MHTHTKRTSTRTSFCDRLRHSFGYHSLSNKHTQIEAHPEARSYRRPRIRTRSIAHKYLQVSTRVSVWTYEYTREHSHEHTEHALDNTRIRTYIPTLDNTRIRTYVPTCIYIHTRDTRRLPCAHPPERCCGRQKTNTTARDHSPIMCGMITRTLVHDTTFHFSLCAQPTGDINSTKTVPIYCDKTKTGRNTNRNAAVPFVTFTPPS